MEFIFVKLFFTIRLNKDIADRYALFGIRNDFREIFRRVACSNESCPATCADSACSYHYTFSQQISEEQTAVKRHQKPSLPFVFDLPILPASPNEGEEVQIGLVIAGSAINFVRDYIQTVRLLFESSLHGGRVPATVIRIESATCTDYRSPVMKAGQNAVLDGVSTISSRDILAMKTVDPGRVRLTIDTPMRLLRDGRPVREFSFSSFVRPLLRRISSLAYYYNYGNGPEPDYKWLSAASASIIAAEDGFHWTDWGEDGSGGRYGGLIGSGVCEGILTDFHFFLLLGEYFHVGKGASFGLGRYRIT